MIEKAEAERRWMLKTEKNYKEGSRGRSFYARTRERDLGICLGSANQLFHVCGGTGLGI
jgi:hypothetical protein